MRGMTGMSGSFPFSSPSSLSSLYTPDSRLSTPDFLYHVPSGERSRARSRSSADGSTGRVGRFVRRREGGAVRSWRAWLGFAISALFLFIAFRGQDFGEVQAALGEVNLAVLLPALGLYLSLIHISEPTRPY